MSDLSVLQQDALKGDQNAINAILKAFCKIILTEEALKNLYFDVKYNKDDPFCDISVGYPIDKLEVGYKSDIIFRQGGKAPKYVETEGFFEPQERAGCGRHALNNLLGGKNFIYEYDPPKDINSIEELQIPVSLQTLCRYISKNSDYLKEENPACPSSENYHIAVLNAGMQLYGFDPIIQIIREDYDEETKQKVIRDKDYVKKEIDKLTNVFGYLIHLPGHWVSIRRLDTDKYEFLNSTNKDKIIGSFDDIFPSFNNFTHITGFTYTGIVNDLTKTEKEKLELIPIECTQAVKEWFDTIKQNVINKEIPKQYVDDFFVKNPTFDINMLRSCIGAYSKGEIFIPKGYKQITSVATPAPASSASSIPASTAFTSQSEIQDLKKRSLVNKARNLYTKTFKKYKQISELNNSDSNSTSELKQASKKRSLINRFKNLIPIPSRKFSKLENSTPNITPDSASAPNSAPSSTSSSSSIPAPASASSFAPAPSPASNSGSATPTTSLTLEQIQLELNENKILIENAKKLRKKLKEIILKNPNEKLKNILTTNIGKITHIVDGLGHGNYYLNDYQKNILTTILNKKLYQKQSI